MWGKILCFLGGATVAYLAREQITEVVDLFSDAPSGRSDYALPASSQEAAAIEAPAEAADEAENAVVDEMATSRQTVSA